MGSISTSVSMRSAASTGPSRAGAATATSPRPPARSTPSATPIDIRCRPATVGPGYPDPMRGTATHAAQVIQAATSQTQPIGSVDSVTNPALNVLAVVGWAADPAAPGPTGRGPHLCDRTAWHAGYAGNYTTQDVPTSPPFSLGGRLDRFRRLGTHAGRGPEHGLCLCDQRESSPHQSEDRLSVVPGPKCFRYLDSVGSATSQLIAGGWAANPNNPPSGRAGSCLRQRPQRNRRYVGFLAGGNRPDVAAAFPGYGAAHGYRAVDPEH